MSTADQLHQAKLDDAAGRIGSVLRVNQDAPAGIARGTR
jgi:hypothetical protein